MFDNFLNFQLNISQLQVLFNEQGFKIIILAPS